MGAFWSDPERLQELVYDLSYLFGLVLLDNVANVVDDLHLEFALHVSYGELLVHALTACKDELLRQLKPKEGVCQVFEPLNPELLTRQQIGAPNILLDSSILIYGLDDLSWH